MSDGAMHPEEALLTFEVPALFARDCLSQTVDDSGRGNDHDNDTLKHGLQQCQ